MNAQMIPNQVAGKSEAGATHDLSGQPSRDEAHQAVDKILAQHDSNPLFLKTIRTSSRRPRNNAPRLQ